MAAQHKATLRVSLRSALKHKKLANAILDSIVQTQTQFNAAMDKIDADSTAASDVDYVSTLGFTNTISADTAGTGAQHKATFRKTLVNALSHKAVANEILDSMEELETSMNALFAKLDAEAGTINDVDYESVLGVTAVDAEATNNGVQHKATMRKSLISALSHRRLANVILDTIIEAQTQVNAALVQLDVDATAGTGALVGLYTPFKVTVIDADAI